MKRIVFTFMIFTGFVSQSQHLQLKKIETGLAVSFRGMSVVDANVAWVSGTKGYIGLTTDGGISWKFTQLKDFAESDFRSIYAFDRLRAIIVNAGSPTTVLVTEDGGQQWSVVYTNTKRDAFVDGIDFWNKNEGIIYGDPIDGAMLMLGTADGGRTWKELRNTPNLEPGEASFAASGTGIRCRNKKNTFICTGGKVSRLWISKDKGEHWANSSTPIIQGEQSTGIFSFTENNDRWIIVGGDFKNDLQCLNHNFYSDNHGKDWLEPAVPTNGYRECVEAISENTVLAVGPSGIDISYDNGMSWKVFSGENGLHVIRKSRKGSLIIAAGSKGQLFLVEESRSK